MFRSKQKKDIEQVLASLNHMVTSLICLVNTLEEGFTEIIETQKNLINKITKSTEHLLSVIEEVKPYTYNQEHLNKKER